MWQEFSTSAKLGWFVFLHFIINIITFFIFFMDDYSIANQIVHTIIHSSFFLLLYQKIYKPNQKSLLKKAHEKYWCWGFIVLNFIPFFQGFEPADNGFVPMWAIAPQINFGIPFPYFYIFTSDVQNLQGRVNNPLIHLNYLFFNLYFWGIVSLIVLLIKRHLMEKRKTKPKR